MDHIIEREANAEIGANYVLKTVSKLNLDRIQDNNGELLLVYFPSLNTLASYQNKSINAKVWSLSNKQVNQGFLSLCGINHCHYDIEEGDVWLEKELMDSLGAKINDKITVLNQVLVIKGIVHNPPKFGQSSFLTYNNVYIHPNNLIPRDRLQKLRMNHFYMVYGDDLDSLNLTQKKIRRIYETGSAFMDFGVVKGRKILDLFFVIVCIFIVVSFLVMIQFWYSRIQPQIKTLLYLGISENTSKKHFYWSSLPRIMIYIMIGILLGAFLAPWIINSVTIKDEFLGINLLFQSSMLSFMLLGLIVSVILYLSVFKRFIDTMIATSFIILFLFVIKFLQYFAIEEVIKIGLLILGALVGILMIILITIVLPRWYFPWEKYVYIIRGRLKAYRYSLSVNIFATSFILACANAVYIQSISFSQALPGNFNDTKDELSIVTFLQPSEKNLFSKKILSKNKYADLVSFKKASIVSINDKKISQGRYDLVIKNMLTDVNSSRSFYIQVDEMIAKKYNVSPGDRLVLNIQGELIEFKLKKIIQGVGPWFDSNARYIMYYPKTIPYKTDFIIVNMNSDDLGTSILQPYFPSTKVYNVRSLMGKSIELIRNIISLLILSIIIGLCYVLMGLTYQYKILQCQNIRDNDILYSLGLPLKDILIITMREKRHIIRLCYVPFLVFTVMLLKVTSSYLLEFPLIFG